MPVLSTSTAEFVEFVRRRLGNHWIVGAPLALGKPNHLVNALYLAARADASIRLELFTALSLNPPKPSTGLKQRFLGPFIKRQFGDYPRLEYLQDLDRGTVPGNISISEFYFRSGSRLHDRHAQRHYVSSNYTHVARDMQAKGVNLLVQMVAADAQRSGYYSLASNPDVTPQQSRPANSMPGGQFQVHSACGNACTEWAWKGPDRGVKNWSEGCCSWRYAPPDTENPKIQPACIQARRHQSMS